MPTAQAMIQGSRTMISNFSEISSAFRREPDHILKFLLKELATKGGMEGNKAVFQGKFSPPMVNRKLELYAKLYVFCPACGKPDTKIMKVDRFDFIKCEACGAKHQVSKV
jgi:translation initiation factor 2 subunit 2